MTTGKCLPPASCLLPPAYCLSPAHEVHNLYPVVFLQHSRGPVSATHYVLIEFDCYSLGCEVELCDQFVKREIVDDFAVFPVYSQVQETCSTCSGSMNNAPQFSLTSSGQGLYQNGRAARSEFWYLSRNSGHSISFRLH